MEYCGGSSRLSLSAVVLALEYDMCGFGSGFQRGVLVAHDVSFWRSKQGQVWSVRM